MIDAVVRPGLPVTERVLNRLGPQTWLWILIWGSIAVIRPAVLFAALNLSRQAAKAGEIVNVLPSQLVLAYITVVTLWGTGRLVAGARRLAPEMAAIAGTASRPDFFPGLGSTIGPLVLLAAITTVSVLAELPWGTTAVLADLPFMIVNILPVTVFVWTYLALLAGLDRLGRVRLQLDPFPQDRSLGLSAVGSIALTGFWLLLLAAIPLIIVASDNVTTVGISLTVIAASVGLLFLSMIRLHGQMAAMKVRYLELARRLYSEAYAPVRVKRSLKSLQAQAPALQVAQAMLERAERILEWPIDERATAWVVVVVTGVITSLLVRLVLAAAGA
jgi:hypothetical protein